MLSINRRNFLKGVCCTGVLLTAGILLNNKILNKNIKFVNEDFTIMGTKGKLQIFSENKEYNMDLTIDEAKKRMKRIDELASKYRMDSETSKINLNPNVYQKVSKDMLNIIKKSQKYFTLTNGYFDFGLGNYLTISGIDPYVPLVGKTFFKENIFNNEIIKIYKNNIKLIRENSMLDFGGIAKGYAIDEGIKILKKNGVKHAAIEIGGDIKVYGGMPNNKPWIIAISNQINNKFVKLKNGSVSISAGYIKKSTNNINNIKHHIINPEKLRSENIHKSIIVIGKNCTTCDALSTAYYNIPIKKINDIKKNFPNYSVKIY